MAYNNGNNYRNNGYNGGYNNNRNRNNNNHRYNNYNNGNPQRRNTNIKTFDASAHKKPDIEIIDLNGKIYKIKGNFSTAFSSEILKTIKQVEKIKKNSNDINVFPEMHKLLKDWCLTLINLNSEGKVYTMDDVNSGFDDIYVLYNLIGYVAKVIAADTNSLKLAGAMLENNS